MAPNWHLNHFLYCPDNNLSEYFLLTSPTLFALVRKGYHVYLIAFSVVEARPHILALVPAKGSFYLFCGSCASANPTSYYLTREYSFTSLENVYSFIVEQKKAGNLRGLELAICLKELKNRMVLDKARF